MAASDSSNRPPKGTPGKSEPESLFGAQDWAALLRHAPGYIVRADREGRITDLNRFFPNLDPEQVLGASLYDFVDDAYKESLKRNLARVLGEQATEHFEVRSVVPGQAPVWFEGHMGPILQDGEVTGIVLFASDVTARKEAEEALRQSEAKYRTIVESTSEGIWTIDTQGSTTFASEQMARMIGYTPEEMLGHSMYDFMDEEARREAEKNLARCNSGISERHDFRLRHKEGRDVWTRMETDPITDESGKVVGALALVTDISAQKAAQDTLERRTRELELVLDAIPDLYFRLDAQGTYLWAHSSVPDLLLVPPEEFLGKRQIDVLPAPLGETLQKLLDHSLATGEMTKHEYSLEVGGRQMFFEARIFPVAKDEVLSVVEDVTERRLHEEEQRLFQEKMLETQKSESLGLLAGGIAHDFNNLLAVILTNAEMALRRLERDHALRPSMESLREATLRAAELTKQMLAYAGRGRLLIEPLSLASLTAEMAGLFETTISKKARLEINVDSSIPLVRGDRAQLGQLLMNVLLNASESLGGREGRIRVAAWPTRASRTMLSEFVNGEKLTPGTYVCLEVSDMGAGMDSATLQKMFDPFFTTKGTGRGLGLSAVSGIVRSHGGALRVISAPGEGTCCQILLPVAPAPAQGTFASEETPPVRGSGTVLLAEDETRLRESLTRVLQEAGYRVLTASNGANAVEVFRAHADEIGLVLLDMNMPLLAGEEVLPELRHIRPNVPVILTSGFTKEAALERVKTGHYIKFMQKPFSIVSFLDTVARALGG